MKNIEKLAILITVLMLILMFGPLLLNMFSSMLSGPEGSRAVSSLQRTSATLSGVLRLLVQIGIGIWIFKLASKEPAAMPWIWFLLCLLFSIYAPVLFFLIKIYNSVKPTDRAVT